MRYEVRFTAGAEQDLDEIHAWIAEADSIPAADRVLERILDAAAALDESANRGSFPPELLALGVRQYRQVHFKPYRLVYTMHGQTVFVVVVADGRRDLQALLARRLLSR
jgi:toxin ParE1/3/4